MVLTFSEGLLAGGRERRAEGRVQRAKRYFFPHFTRGLRLHRYQSVALKGFFVPEKQCPLRLVVTLVFRFRLPFGKEKKRKRWLTRTSTFRKGKKRERWVDQEVNIAEGEKACEVVDEDVNLPERKKSEGQIRNLYYSGKKNGGI